MNNDNNNFNNNVLGSVDTSSSNNEPIETLDNTPNNNVGNGNSEVNAQPLNTTNNVNPINNEQPAYTNPQSINPVPMPGFEDSNQIGTTPPISLETEKKPKKKGNKFGFILLIIILLALVGFGTYWVLKYTDIINLKAKNNIRITLKEVDMSLGDPVPTDINIYAEVTGTNTNNCELNTSEVDNTKEGTYSYFIKCGNVSEEGKISVTDNKEIEVTTQKVYKSKNEKIDATEFISNKSENLNYEFVEPDSINDLLNGEPGTYTVKIKASNSNKSVTVDGTLVIIANPIMGYLSCREESTITNPNAKLNTTMRFAIVNDGKNGYGNIAYQVSLFELSDTEEYNKYKQEVNKTITINNVTGVPTFDDNNKTIEIITELDNDEVISKYGADVMTNYGKIKDYFGKTLNQNCVYDIVKQ